MAQVVIGLTGVFGSGCSTAAEHLRDKHGFRLVKLSAPIKARWKVDHPAEEPKRGDLQRLGDEMRQAHGLGILVDQALGEDKTQPRIAIDSIRNEGEIARLRDLFGYNFLLFAVLSSSEARWDRLSARSYHNLGLTEVDFHEDVARDTDEGTEWGQQVEACVAQADIFVDNADAKLREFKKDVSAIADLVTGTTPRGPTQDEIWMHLAYGTSHGSRCLKRHVGAVVVDAGGIVVGTGFNENPAPTKPCADEPTYKNRCYRDIIRAAHFKMLSKANVACPVCSRPIPEITGPWACPHCAAGGVETNLERYFVPDKAMSWCTAIHAEARALDAAGKNARGGTLYTTTFPCTQCSEKIVEAGVARVYFTEVYTDLHSAERLALGNVDVRRFTGVRSASFERIFAQVRPK